MFASSCVGLNISLRETASKLILTCDYEERSMLEVVASSCDEQGLSVGCTIIVPTHVGMPIKFDNADYIVVKKSDRLGSSIP